VRRAALAGALLVALCFSACGGSGDPEERGAPGATATDPAGPAWFSEEAARRGLDFTWVSGHQGRHYFPEIMGGGAALLDVEGDGDLDVYLVQAGRITDAPAARPANQLFLNRGDGRFEDAGPGCGAADRGFGMGVACGDLDDDGRPDLYVTNMGPNVLYRNLGDGRFEDRTAAGTADVPTWSTSAAFVDPDRDGDLDLVVVNYIRWSVESEITCYTKPHPEDYCSPNSYSAPEPDVLLRNEGDGTFRDVSLEAGLRESFGNGLGIVCSDFDGDGWTDLFVANDGMLNQLWHNQGDGTFLDRGISMGCAVDQDGRKKAGMGTAAADVDFDGDEDLLVVNLAGETDSFYRNDGTHFSDRTPLSGLAGTSRPFTRFGLGFADFDLDGLLDVYEANGRVTRDPEASAARPFEEPNVVFRGVAGGRFEELRPRGGTASELVATSRAAAFGDLDGDGATDVVVVNRDEPAYLLLNRVPGRGRGITFRVRERSGRDALGAIVRCQVGATGIMRVVRSAYSYCAASDPAVIVGLGPAPGVSDVTVQWVDGTVEAFGDLEGGRVHELARGAGTTR
jgi:hypothetical protein